MQKLVSAFIAVAFAVSTPFVAQASNVSLLQDKYQQNYMSLSGLAPGMTFTRTLTLFNPYTEDHTVRLIPVDVASSDYFFPLKDIHSTQTSIGKWIAATDKLVVPALSAKKVDVQVTIPSYVPYGAYAGGLLLEDLTGGDMEMKMRVYFVVDTPLLDAQTAPVTIAEAEGNGYVAPKMSRALQYPVKSPRVVKKNFSKVVTVTKPSKDLFFNEKLNKRIRMIRTAESVDRMENSHQVAQRKYKEAITRMNYRTGI